ncbi:MAG: hypothetical protein B7Z73_01545 [Planctomycetia bacterium 21-64-5]|nr:MAG: hypothetical protein B7Z73_01545 [Planctomycetia bacterium 21-64-5]HQU41302.1 hypothetical protein [Pirellulales bacterium]
MKILFVVPHYFDPRGGASHQSLSGNPQPRVEALAACLRSLHHLFGSEQSALDIARRLTVPANAEFRHAIDVVLCTVGERHVLARLPFSANVYQQHACRCEPKLLGFECQQVLRDALDRYDYYCYLEDDLVIHDPLFFTKLAWFTREAGSECLLQPNRYETPDQAVGRKLYVDGDLRSRVHRRLLDQRSLPELRRQVLGAEIVFRGALNPHAGCFCLSAAQMRHWAAQPWFGDRDTSFIGPLESAATLGILRTFHIYKPALEHAAFLEIQHYGEGYLGYAGGGLPFAQ